MAREHQDGLTGNPVIRPYQQKDHCAVRELFVRVNRELAPPALAGNFETYIERSLREEIDRIPEYYASERGAGFWVAIAADLAGMFGLEPAGDHAVELRRMYVAPDRRRCGLGSALLARAENEARQLGAKKLILSTSEIQGAALALYRARGFLQVREEVAETASNRTVGSGIRRFHFSKCLREGGCDGRSRDPAKEAT